MCVTCCLEFEVFAQRGQLFTTLNLCFVASEVSHTLPCVSWLCVAVQVKPWLESWFQFCCFGSWETALGIDVRSPRGVLLVNIGICYSLWCHLPVHWQFQLIPWFLLCEKRSCFVFRILDLNGGSPPLTYKRFLHILSLLGDPEVPVRNLTAEDFQ